MASFTHVCGKAICDCPPSWWAPTPVDSLPVFDPLPGLPPASPWIFPRVDGPVESSPYDNTIPRLVFDRPNLGDIIQQLRGLGAVPAVNPLEVPSIDDLQARITTLEAEAAAREERIRELEAREKHLEERLERAMWERERARRGG